ncbi:hypothetical protein B0J14DRAFT_568612 [Halenospora varia]|nr:hypothetical protein B0J14DRAFT_568612 [Halenospora varia]
MVFNIPCVDNAPKAKLYRSKSLPTKRGRTQPRESRSQRLESENYDAVELIEARDIRRTDIGKEEECTKPCCTPSSVPKYACAKARNISPINKMLNELLLKIAEYVPIVSSVCFGLTSNRHYKAHLRVTGLVDLGDFGPKRVGTQWDGKLEWWEMQCLHRFINDWMWHSGYVYSDRRCLFIREDGSSEVLLSVSADTPSMSD